MKRRHEKIFSRRPVRTSSSAPPFSLPSTEDGVYDAPLAPDGHPPHRRLVGRDAIRAGISVYHQQPTYQGALTVPVETNDLEAA